MSREKKIKPRNPYVIPGKSRSGAGPMHDRRESKGGSRNTLREDLEAWEEEAVEADKQGHDQEREPPANSQDQPDNQNL